MTMEISGAGASCAGAVCFRVEKYFLLGIGRRGASAHLADKRAAKLQRCFGVFGWNLFEPIPPRQVPIADARRRLAHLSLPSRRKLIQISILIEVGIYRQHNFDDLCHSCRVSTRWLNT